MNIGRKAIGLLNLKNLFLFFFFAQRFICDSFALNITVIINEIVKMVNINTILGRLRSHNFPSSSDTTFGK
jgi:hypothetical protein